MTCAMCDKPIKGESACNWPDGAVTHGDCAKAYGRFLRRLARKTQPSEDTSNA